MRKSYKHTSSWPGWMTRQILCWTVFILLAGGFQAAAQEAKKILYVQHMSLRDTVKMIGLLRAQGHDVTVHTQATDGNSLTAAEYAAQGYELLIADETIGSNIVGNRFRNSPIPVITWEGFLYSGDRSAFNADSGLNGGTFASGAEAQAANDGAGADFGQVQDLTAINITNPNHPLAAGLSSGLINVFDPNAPPAGTDGNGVITFIGARTLMPGAEVVATVPDFPSGYSIAGVDAGTTRADGSINQARWVHLPWNNSVEDRVMIEPSFFLFEAAVAWALELPQPTKIYNLMPEGGGFLPSETTISFSVDKMTAAGSPVATANIQLLVNGVNVVGDAVISDNGTQWSVSYSGLPANQNLAIIASATAADGGFSARMTQLDTFDPNNYSVEAEDFNFDGGQFFDSIVLCNQLGGGVEGCYFDRVGVQGIDKNEINQVVTVAVPLETEVYRFGPGFTRDEFVDTYLTNDPLLRQKYVDAGIDDYEVRNIVANEWLNYTRTFPEGTFHVYARLSSAGPMRVQMDRVDNPTGESQTLTKLGQFVTDGTAGYELVPLTDDSGSVPLVVGFDGVPATVRMTALSAGHVVNFYMLVPTEGTVTLPPTIAITSPEEFAVSAGTLNVTVDVSGEAGIAGVEYYAGTSGPLTLVGEVSTPPYSFSFEPVTPDPVNIYTIRAVVRDQDGLSAEDSVVIKVIDPSHVVATTADDNGADAELRENDGGDTANGTGPQLNARITITTGDMNRHEVIGLRFNLGATDMSEISEASLNLISFRTLASRNLRVHGVIAGTMGLDNGPLGLMPGYTDANWDETAVVFSTMPGLVWDGNSTTRGLNNVVDLGVLNQARNKGEVWSFSTPQLLSFLREHPAGVVTLLIESDDDNTGQSRFASKEATALDGGSPTGPAGWFAPYLSVRVGGGIAPLVVISSPDDGATFSEGSEVTVTATVTADASITGVEFFAGVEEPLTLVGSAGAQPYSVSFTPPGPGQYTIRAVATDSQGLTGQDEIGIEVLDAAVVRVTTAAGAGADAELRENTNESSGANSVSMNTRYNNNDRNEVIALRFDLTGHDLAALSDVALSVIAFRSDGQSRAVGLYGVHHDATPAMGSFTVDTWDENSVAFATMPGLVFDADSTTRSINTEQVTFLGMINYTAESKGIPQTFSDPAITGFLQNYGGDNLVTFLLAQAPDTTSGGQGRIASKEATALDGGEPTGSAGDFAPYLSFRLGGPLITLSAVIEGNQLRLTWSGGSGPYTVQKKTAIDGSWVDEITGIADTTVTVPITGDAGFFRVRGQ